MDRFWAKVDKSGECWIWTGCVNRRSGYGGFQVNGEKRLAHRVAWELAHGPIPHGPGFHGVCVCHKCDERRCVRPDHLFLATQAENIADRDAKGRRSSTRGEQHPSNKLTADVVLAIRARVQAGELQYEVASAYGVSKGLISMIVNRKIWTHI